MASLACIMSRADLLPSDIILGQLRGEIVHEAWPHMEPLFSAACRRLPTDLTPASILYRATTGRCDLWAIYWKHEPLPLLGAAVTGIRDGVIALECLGGRDIWRWWRECLAQFERMAKDNGMKAIEIEGRTGWKKLLTEYRPMRITMRKELR